MKTKNKTVKEFDTVKTYRDCFEMNQKINYTAKLIHEVLPSPLEREDAGRQMGGDSRRIKNIREPFQNSL